MSGATELTREGEIVGTLAYLSPESISGNPLDIQSDIYSLGTVLYEMLTGQTPFQGDSPAVLMQRIINDTAQPPSRYTDVPEKIERVVMKMIARDAHKRYQTMKEVAGALQATGMSDDQSGLFQQAMLASNEVDESADRGTASEYGFEKQEEVVSPTELMMLSKDLKSKLRQKCDLVIANSPNSIYVPDVIPLLKDANWQVRRAALAALGACNGQSTSRGHMQPCQLSGLECIHGQGPSRFRKHEEH
jgi:serine/threonine protein kinase